MIRNKAKPQEPVLFLLDELPTLGYMRPIEEGIGYLAGYGCKLWLFVQGIRAIRARKIRFFDWWEWRLKIRANE